MAKVILKDISKIYPNGFKAVYGHNLEIKDGEFMVFVGPSGCAKSTTLRMIAGLEDISDGECYIGDRLVNDVTPKDRHIAMVFQNYALYPHMNVYKNMAFGLKLAKVDKETIDQRVREAAHILGITDLLYRKPKEMSGGQRQRVALGRALVRDPEVFLFDEPLSNLDAKLRVHMRVEIAKLHKKLKTTIIYVTHDQVEAMTMGDRICVMDLGKIKQVDTPMDLYDKPKNKFVAGFIGSPAMNMLSGKLEEGRGGEVYFITQNREKLLVPKDKIEKVKDYIGESIWLGIRPEDITIVSDLDEGNKNMVVCGVEVVEQMGNEVVVYFSVGKDQQILRESSESTVKSGETIKMKYDMSKCHFFDKESEENISL